MARGAVPLFDSLFTVFGGFASPRLTYLRHLPQLLTSSPLLGCPEGWNPYGTGVQGGVPLESSPPDDGKIRMDELRLAGTLHYYSTSSLSKLAQHTDKSIYIERWIATDGKTDRGLINNRWIYLWLRVEAPDTLILPMVGLPL